MEINMIGSIIIFAVLLEAIISYGKKIVVKKQIKWQVIAGIVIGVILGILFEVDIFSALGFKEVYPVAGYACTGIILSRGANYMFDLMSAISGVAAKLKNSATNK